jgi:CheY-like chemotaxis protein
MPDRRKPGLGILRASAAPVLDGLMTTILVIDDVPEIRNLVTAFLTDERFPVTTCE